MTFKTFFGIKENSHPHHSHFRVRSPLSRHIESNGILHNIFQTRVRHTFLNRRVVLAVKVYAVYAILLISMGFILSGYQYNFSRNSLASNITPINYSNKFSSAVPTDHHLRQVKVK